MKKIFYFLAILLGVSIVTLLVVRLAPFDMVKSSLQNGGLLSQEKIVELNYAYGKGGSFIEQYFAWLKGVAVLDFGESFLYKDSVLKIVGERLLNSSFLIVVSFVLSFILSFFTGVAMYFSKSLKWLIVALSSVPTFLLGSFLIAIFAVKLGIFPMILASPIGRLSDEVAFLDRISHSVLPIACLTLSLLPSLAIRMHTKVEEISTMDYANYLRIRGDGDLRIFCKSKKNILLSFTLVQFSSLSSIISLTVVVEQVFSYTGIGSSIFETALVGDRPYLMGVSVILASLIVASNFLGEILTEKFGLVGRRL